MIEVYTGTPGSGKSYHLVSRIYATNKRRIPIISNVILDVKRLKHPDLYYFVDSFDMNENKILSIAKEYYDSTKKKLKEHSILLVLDECQLFLNSRDFHDKERKNWMHFFSIHRHLGFDIVMVTQSLTFIDKQARLLAEFEVQHMHTGKIFMFRLFELLLLNHKIFLAKSFHIATKHRCSLDWVIGRKKIYQIYNTFQEFPVFLEK